MINLDVYKAVLDKANARVEQIMGRINAALNEGTEAGVDKALALRPILKAAQAEAADAEKLYRSKRNASIVDVAGQKRGPGDELQLSSFRILPRAAFDTLSAKERRDFVRRGGVVKG